MQDDRGIKIITKVIKKEKNHYIKYVALLVSKNLKNLKLK